MRQIFTTFIFVFLSAVLFGQSMTVTIDGVTAGTGTKANNNNTNLFTVNYGSNTSLTLDFLITGASPVHNSSEVTIDNGTSSTNTAPVLSSISDITVTEGDLITITAIIVIN